MNKYPNIAQRQLINAKIYSNRWDWAASLPRDLDIIEVGVGSGDYSEHMIKTISPKTLTLIDQYDQSDPFLARPGQKPRFYENDHYNFIQNKFKEYKNVKIIKDNSVRALPELIKTGKRFDMIYVDASHHYKDVSQDILNASSLLKDSGILAINDYVYDVEYEQYGVIQATNEFLYNNSDWYVIGFALEERMMADIYLSKHPQ
jgi:SAM-dependent methyltransferase